MSGLHGRRETPGRTKLVGSLAGPIPDADLYVTEIGIFPKLSTDQYADVFDEITITLSNLVSEQPNAYDVLRGRTFARSLQ